MNQFLPENGPDWIGLILIVGTLAIIGFNVVKALIADFRRIVRFDSPLDDPHRNVSDDVRRRNDRIKSAAVESLMRMNEPRNNTSAKYVDIGAEFENWEGMNLAGPVPPCTRYAGHADEGSGHD